jgi:hypothetical protein
MVFEKVFSRKPLSATGSESELAKTPPDVVGLENLQSLVVRFFGAAYRIVGN